MYFKRLEIFGFKSFAEKTVLDFQPGITAVVGPNGCGKSNVFDSIRWVLGEQSVKELRGSSMEDVIFNGTDKKPALGFAEVSVTFSNESRILPIEYDEVTVTRRLFRSGESEYLLNKNVCRLKDIVELFMGTGVGAEAYSLIQQGKVDLVVSAKPDDRRQIFDEAAGITKYKSKKREALNKLKDTEDNLIRINDIVVEVKRQIATIERQAKKAQRYKEEFEQLKGFELIMAQYHLGRFNTDLVILNEENVRLQTQEGQLTAQLQELNNRLDYETSLIEVIDEEINALKSQQMRLNNDIDINTRQIDFNQERLENIDSTCARLEEDKASALERCKVNQNKIEEIKSTLTGLIETLDFGRKRLEQKREEFGVLVHAINEAQESIKVYEEERAVLHGQETYLKNQLTEHMKRNMELLARRERLEKENYKVIDEKTQVSQRFDAISSAIFGVQTQLEQSWAYLNNQRGIMEDLKLRFVTLESELDELEKQRLFLLSQKDFIAKMQTQYQDIPEPVVEGRFISPVRPSDKQTGIIGKIKSVIELAPQDTTGIVTYEITYETKYVELDIACTDERIAGIDTQLLGAQESIAILDREINVQDQAVNEALKNIQEQEKRLSVLEAQKGDIELETGKIVGEIDLITSEFAQVEGDLAALIVKEQELNGALSRIADELVCCQEDIRVKHSAIALKHKDREDLNVAIIQIEADVVAVVNQQKNLEENISVYRQSLDRDLADVSRFEVQFQELLAKKVVLNEDILRLNELIVELRVSSNVLATQLNEQTAQKNEMLQRLSSLRNQSRLMEDEIIASKTQRHALDMRQQEIQFNLRSLKDRLIQTYKIDIDHLPVVELQSTEQPAPKVNYEELGLEIERLKKRCEGYGAVNLVAIEEFEELKQRFEFLTKQQSDLLTARESLMQTIQKINRTTRQMFTDTFVKVNEEFQIYFRMLFGGGEAQLVLLEPENALESGIDIVVRPPGKKLQNISLLSGGEKTLTAIALIFGVFKVNPSPFCVLDEIDAALDESNVARFALLLKEFAKIAQFIVITHNKKTMEGADVMYGVTMPERGISRLVSVKFNQNLPKPASEPVLDIVEQVIQPVAIGV